MASSLAWYRAVAANRNPAKFRIARTIPVALSLAQSSEDELWDEIDRLTPLFLARWRGIREARDALGPPGSGASLLELCRELTRRMLSHCNFCQWNCQIDRAGATKFGACKLGADTRVSSYFHHPGEELVYRGTHGSGTIFFTPVTCAAPSARMATSARIRTTGWRSMPMILPSWPGCYAWRVATTSTG